MTINTRDFGEVEISEEDVVTFVNPILGFENLSRFVFLTADDEFTGLSWLQSLEEESICFILTAPLAVNGAYAPRLPEAVLSQLGENVQLWLVTVVTEDFTQSTVNLKSPIVLNAEKKLAAQVVLDDDLPIRKKVFEN